MKTGLWLGAESNRRHVDFQSTALPTELPSHLLRENGLYCHATKVFVKTHPWYLDLRPFNKGRKFFKTKAEAEAARDPQTVPKNRPDSASD